MASSSALCVLGVARLISSASTSCANSGPGWNSKRLLVALEYAHTDNVRWQQVAGELHALEAQVQRRGQCVGQRGLADAGQVFDEQMAAGEQADEGKVHLCGLAQQHAVDLCDGAIKPRAQFGRQVGRGIGCHSSHE